MNRRRRAIGSILAAAIAVVLVGCAAIPTGGSVQVGGKIQDQEPSGVDYRPNGPTKGSDQQTVLKDFIDAATGDQDNYAVAREFLSKSFAQKWNPRQSVTIRSGNGVLARASDRKMTYTLTSSATVDAQGEYTQAVRQTSSTLTFQFVRENGQWRISYAPDGIILSPVSFESVFQAHALYFFDPTYSYLVPDERWFLARSSASTRIASALLDGPSPWLKGAVVSAFPDGTQLSLNAVTVADGAAQVDLTSDALKANATEKARMRLQLTTSLSSIASVSSVDLTVEGTSQSIPESAGNVQRDPDVDPRPLVATSTTVGYATNGDAQVSALSNLGAKIAAIGPLGMELSGTGTSAAVRTAAGVYIARTSTSAPLRLDARSGLIDPSIDDAGYVWSVPATQPRGILAIGPNGDQHPIASTLPSGRIVSFEVSRDSTRALALIRGSDGAALYVMSIVRNSHRQPTALGTPIRVEAAGGTPVDATWESDLEVASIGSSANGTSVVSTTIGGASTALPKPNGTATTIVGGSSDSLLLRMTDGKVLAQTGGGWDSTGITTSVLGTQR